MGGGYFQFWSKNRPQKHKKRAILHTLQANGEQPPPPLATLLYWSDLCHKSWHPKKEEITTTLTELNNCGIEKSTILTNLWFKFKTTILCSFLNQNTT